MSAIWLDRINALIRHIVIIIMICLAKSVAQSAETQVGVRYFSIEFYYRGSVERDQQYLKWFESELGQRRGVRLIRYDLDQVPTAKERLAHIANYFKANVEFKPALYGCKFFRNQWSSEQAFRQDLRTLLRMDVYGRAGCPHCAEAKVYLKQLQTTYPGLEVVYHEITTEPGAADAVQQLAQRYRQGATSVPVFHFCQRLIVGFDDIANSRQRIEEELNRWSYVVKQQSSQSNSAVFQNRTTSLIAIPLPVLPSITAQTEEPTTETEEFLPLPGEALPLSGELPLPSDGQGDSQDESTSPAPAGRTITLPVFGKLNLNDTGMPLFTIAIGLVDGFNPCAMWVLVFLLSILVNIKSRWRMLVIAGTFVTVSGVVYFMFMAAWLSLFMFVGLLRPVQIGLALLAIFVGSVHVKDFFAFKKGLSFSIPEFAKPGIYARVRKVLNAEHLAGAMFSVVTLAIMVNIVELLCTAGLPALYTEILTVQEYPAWKNYAYLVLYNLAYMFDDGLMVCIVVLTMSKTRMQETHGRWLKLLSGLVILILGLVMLLKPDWLV